MGRIERCSAALLSTAPIMVALEDQKPSWPGRQPAGQLPVPPLRKPTQSGRCLARPAIAARAAAVHSLRCTEASLPSGAFQAGQGRAAAATPDAALTPIQMLHSPGGPAAVAAMPLTPVARTPPMTPQVLNPSPVLPAAA
ncbi:UNVERIFIED_CONTAM: hypothetical protein K2H54_002647 [Gekko kuhli]